MLLLKVIYIMAGMAGVIPRVGSHALPQAYTFNWRPVGRERAMQEVKDFKLTSAPVGVGTIRRSEGEFGALRKRGISYHKGVDFIAAPGTPVRAASSGFVCYNSMNGGPDRGYGYTVIIDHANNFYTLYAHLKGESRRDVGEWVGAGEQIGRVGRSGNARQLPKEFQYQLHFEIIHAPSGLMDLGGIQITSMFSTMRITMLRLIGEAVYGVYWGGVLNPEEFRRF
jgi:murein DD-endopeptidase MepM/ murein hydrolase activator NlpD